MLGRTGGGIGRREGEGEGPGWRRVRRLNKRHVKEGN